LDGRVGAEASEMIHGEPPSLELGVHGLISPKNPAMRYAASRGKLKTQPTRWRQSDEPVVVRKPEPMNPGDWREDKTRVTRVGVRGGAPVQKAGDAAKGRTQIEVSK